MLSVHRVQVGDELTVGLAAGPIGTGTITLLTESAAEMDVRLENQPPAALPLTLILALPRPKVLNRVLRGVSAMGVKKIILLNAYRVEKSYWGSPVLEAESIREQLVIGLEQARDTLLPEVLLRPLFKPFVQDELPGLARNTLRLAAHPGAFDSCPRSVDGPATLAVGPEGGFVPYEIRELVHAGFLPVHLGRRILTVETALPVLLSRLF